MSGYSSKFISGINYKRIPAELLLILSAFSVGLLIAVIFDFQFYFDHNVDHVLKNCQSIFSGNPGELYAIKSLLEQLKNEFVVLFVSSATIYISIPKTTVAILVAAYGYQISTALHILFMHSYNIDLFAVIITVIFELVFSCVILYSVARDLHSIAVNRNEPIHFELALIFSEVTFSRLYSSIHTYGSLILLNIIKSLLLSLINIF